jgi:hypothetical protein
MLNYNFPLQQNEIPKNIHDFEINIQMTEKENFIQQV